MLLILVDAAVWMFVSQPVHGAGRTRSAGIRLPSLMASDQAWRAGHVAARSAMAPFLGAAAVIAALSVPLQLAPVLYVISVGLSLASTVLALGVGSARAARAARRVARHPAIEMLE
ncbi:hypothetical protein [Cellulomonas sp. IC4_254]|uniref:hypothetical protein n=1 Tax=Cellulomonas sp. IC4_254 TaxID=2714040 RepID=UPI0014222ADA|nr:hypothetical protein [Cellulomonas sp. IC4_254]NHT16128.1 hypothetical protein [Cellulomonas sp. IC4_254]